MFARNIGRVTVTILIAIMLLGFGTHVSVVEAGSCGAYGQWQTFVLIPNLQPGSEEAFGFARCQFSGHVGDLFSLTCDGCGDRSYEGTTESYNVGISTIQGASVYHSFDSYNGAIQFSLPVTGEYEIGIDYTQSLQCNGDWKCIQDAGNYWASDSGVNLLLNLVKSGSSAAASNTGNSSVPKPPENSTDSSGSSPSALPVLATVVAVVGGGWILANRQRKKVGVGAPNFDGSVTVAASPFPLATSTETISPTPVQEVNPPVNLWMPRQDQNQLSADSSPPQSTSESNDDPPANPWFRQ